MIKSNSYKLIGNETVLTTEENKKTSHRPKVDTLRTKQNSKVLKEKEKNIVKKTTAKDFNGRNKNESNNFTLHTTPNALKKTSTNLTINKFSKKSFVKTDDTIATRNLTSVKTVTPKPKSNKFQNMSKKSIKEDETNKTYVDDVVNTIISNKTVNTTPSKPSSLKVNRFERHISLGSIKEDILPKSKMTSPGLKTLTLKKQTTDKNKFFRDSEKVIKELEESKIKDDVILTEVLNTKTENKIKTFYTGEKLKQKQNTINSKLVKRNQYLTTSPMKDNLKASFKTEKIKTAKSKITHERAKSIQKTHKSSNNNEMGFTNTKHNFFKTGTNFELLKNTNFKKTMPPKIRPKSVFNKPDIELKLNEASLSTEASSHFRGRIEDYAIGKEIGKGAYAIVKQAFHKVSNRKMAIKIYEKVKLLDTQRKNSVKREIQILKKLDNLNIVKLYEVIDNPKQILLVMELVNGVSLLTYIKSKPERRIEEMECKNIFFQIVQAIAHCHKKNICHRDIKLENIIIEENKLIKVIDFGFGTVTAQNKMLNFFCGTPSYMPPEIVQKKEYIGEAADIWSLGILMYTLLCGAFPFRALSEKELYEKITKGVYNFADHMSSVSSDLVRRILSLTPSKRPSAGEILNDVWFESHNDSSPKIIEVSLKTITV